MNSKIFVVSSLKSSCFITYSPQGDGNSDRFADSEAMAIPGFITYSPQGDGNLEQLQAHSSFNLLMFHHLFPARGWKLQFPRRRRNVRTCRFITYSPQGDGNLIPLIFPSIAYIFKFHHLFPARGWKQQMYIGKALIADFQRRFHHLFPARGWKPRNVIY